MTAPGPAGPFIGPVSGAECAWYTVQLQRTPSRSKDESPPPYDVVLEVFAPTPPALADDSGSVLIDPALLTEAPNLDDPVVTDVMVRIVSGGLPNPAPTVVTQKHIDSTRSSESLRVVETRLDAGKAAYAFGSAGRHKGLVMLKPSRRGVTVLTTDDHSTVVARRHTNARETRSLAIFLGQAGLVVTAAATALLFFVV